jgi:hypothetical protein
MAYIDDLKTARDNYARQLAEISVDPKPSYKVGPQSFTWKEYQEFLAEQVNSMNRLISRGEPFETTSIVR